MWRVQGNESTHDDENTIYSYCILFFFLFFDSRLILLQVGQQHIRILISTLGPKVLFQCYFVCCCQTCICFPKPHLARYMSGRGDASAQISIFKKVVSEQHQSRDIPHFAWRKITRAVLSKLHLFTQIVRRFNAVNSVDFNTHLSRRFFIWFANALLARVTKRIYYYFCFNF